MLKRIKLFDVFLIKEAKLFSDLEKDSARIEAQKKSVKWSELYLYSLFYSHFDGISLKMMFIEK